MGIKWVTRTLFEPCLADSIGDVSFITVDYYHCYLCLPHFFTWGNWTSGRLHARLTVVRGGLWHQSSNYCSAYAPSGLDCVHRHSGRLMFYTIHSFLNNYALSAVPARERRGATGQRPAMRWTSPLVKTKALGLARPTLPESPLALVTQALGAKSTKIKENSLLVPRWPTILDWALVSPTLQHTLLSRELWTGAGYPKFCSSLGLFWVLRGSSNI